MALAEKTLTGSISQVSLTGVMNVSAGLTGNLDTGQKTSANDYNTLINKPKRNGAVLISDRSFEDLGDHVLTNDEILEILIKAGF